MSQEKVNGEDPLREQIRRELEPIGQISIDFLRRLYATKRESGISLPRIPRETMQLVRGKLDPVMGQPNPIQANKALELGLNDLVLNLARDFEETGQNFRLGAGFACLVFRELKEAGYNPPPVSKQVIETFEQNYNKALTKFAQITAKSLESNQTRVAFLKGMLIFGYLAHQLYEQDNPELIELFRSFGANRPFATEGAILVYHLKTDQYLLDHKPQT